MDSMSVWYSVKRFAEVIYSTRNTNLSIYVSLTEKAPIFRGIPRSQIPAFFHISFLLNRLQLN